MCIVCDDVIAFPSFGFCQPHVKLVNKNKLYSLKINHQEILQRILELTKNKDNELILPRLRECKLLFNSESCAQQVVEKFWLSN